MHIFIGYIVENFSIDLSLKMNNTCNITTFKNIFISYIVENL